MPTGKVFKRGNDWCLCINTGRKTNTKRGYEQIRRKAQGRTKAEAQRELDAELYRLNRAAAIGGAMDNKYTLSALLDDWSQEIEVTTTDPKTRKEYIRHATRAVEALESTGVVAVDQLSRSAAVAMLRHITESDGLSHNIANKALAKLGALLEYGAKTGLIAAAPDLPPSLPEKRVKFRRAYTPEEVKALLDASTNTWRSTFHWLASTGMRIDEYRHVRWVDLDLEKKTVRVTARPGWKPKTKAGERTIPLSDNLVETIRGIPKRSEYLFSTKDGGQRENNIRRHHLNTVKRALRALYPEYGQEQIEEQASMLDLHSLRYTFCTELIKNGVDIKTVQRLMGHSSVQTTLNIYAQYCAQNAALAITVLPY